MGYGVIPYSVNINVLDSPHSYAADPDGFLAGIQDRHCGDEDEYGPTRQSMREMFFGEPFTGTEGHVYGYTLQALCDIFGGRLDNENWYPVGTSWFDTVRAGLAQAGVDFDPRDLVFTGSPVDLPPIDDFPCIGYLRRDEAIPLSESLDAADLLSITDRNVVTSINELHGWLKRCKDDEEIESFNYDLVCFYS